MKQKLPTETPVYLFLGFLESGKTKFIQETLEDPRFSNGEKTLLLVTEEGEEEYETIRFANAEQEDKIPALSHSPQADTLLSTFPPSLAILLLQ